MPKITVIVPAYKVEPYLRRCVDSILNQTFTDFELILVDDGSPDGCGAICDEYIDPRITVIHQSNGGLSAARNSGIDWAFACSDSEWLGFVDSDDWVHPQMYELLHRAACDCSVSLSVCDYQRTLERERFAASSFLAPAVYNGLDFFTSDKNVIATVAWNKLYEKSLFNDYRYPVGKIHEDEFLTYILLYEAGNIAYVDEKLYFYFRNYSGITGSKYSVRNLDKIDAIEEQYRFFSTINNTKYKDIWKLALVNNYVRHINNLRAISETERANVLFKKAKLFFLNDCDDRKEHYELYERAWLMFYPKRTRMKNRYRNFKRMIRSKSLFDVVRYYFEKK